MKTNTRLNRLIITALLLAVGIVLPFLTGQIRIFGKAISPLHIPAFICGLTCGWQWGAVLGIVLPLLRSVMFGMPPLFPTASAMAIELCVYGAVCGLLYPVMRKNIPAKNHVPAMIAAMLVAMLIGRLAGGAAQAVFVGLSGKSYTFDAFVAAYFIGTAGAALLHLIVVPIVVYALEKAKLSPMA